MRAFLSVFHLTTVFTQFPLGHLAISLSYALFHFPRVISIEQFFFPYIFLMGNLHALLLRLYLCIIYNTDVQIFRFLSCVVHEIFRGETFKKGAWHVWLGQRARYNLRMN